MDYVFASVMKHYDVKLHKVVSNNIMCQWLKNLLEHLKALPPHIQPDNISSYNTVIPKLQVYSHNSPCPTDFSLKAIYLV